jgi:hypothetical protein
MCCQSLFELGLGHLKEGGPPEDVHNEHTFAVFHVDSQIRVKLEHALIAH